MVEFRAFYEALYDGKRKPFPWQERLAAAVAEGHLPPLLALPTSSGKTSVLEVLVWALALEAGRSPWERSVPLRLFYVIDRRLVVDEVTESARFLARRLEEAVANPEADSNLRWVAERLLTYTDGIKNLRQPLAVATMRGGMYRQDRWADRPDQPLICVSTVDQVGSRLLFRGYGLTPGRRPIHAGLIGFDTLLIVDEAHLSSAFCATLRRVVELQAAAPEQVAPPLRLLQMTATPESEEAEPFTLTEHDLADAVLGPRLRSSKPTTLLETANLEELAVVQAKALVEEHPHLRVLGVVVNRVDTARGIHRRLVALYGDRVLLLTGRIRPVDRDDLLAEKLRYLKADPNRPVHDPGPLFLVATQTVEVGANLDFDALISEAAPLSSLKQRFGRLNRLGRPGLYPGVIIRRKERSGEDPLYGSALTKTWEWLLRHATLDGQGKKAQHRLDMGISALPSPERDEAADLQVAVRRAHLRRADVAILAETRPEPAAVPDLAPFLHGCAKGARADVSVVWRSDLLSEQESDWREIVRRQPPLIREAMPVPLWAVQRWLNGERTDAGAVSDLVGDPGMTQAGEGLRVLRWRTPEECYVVDPSQIRPGDTIVVPTTYGGSDRFGWAPLDGTRVVDLADRCRAEIALKRRGKADRLTISLHLSHASTFEPMEAQLFEKDLRRLIQLVRAELPPTDESIQRVVAELLAALPPHLRRLQPFVSVAALTRLELYPGMDGVQLSFAVPETSQTLTESDLELLDAETDEEERPPGGDRLITLRAHTDGVVELTERFVKNLALPASLANTLRFAAQYHDVGKVDERFQAVLCGGDPVAVADLPEPLAKSVQNYPAHRQGQILRLSGYPKHQRHEAQSAYLLSTWGGLSDRVAEPTLCIGLAEGHHGWGRPTFPVPSHTRADEVEAELDGELVTASSCHNLWRVDSLTVERFHHLNERFGYWGYAFLQAILRMADQLQSERELDEGREEA